MRSSGTFGSWQPQTKAAGPEQRDTWCGGEDALDFGHHLKWLRLTSSITGAQYSSTQSNGSGRMKDGRGRREDMKRRGFTAQKAGARFLQTGGPREDTPVSRDRNDLGRSLLFRRLMRSTMQSPTGAGWTGSLKGKRKFLFGIRSRSRG